MTPTERENKRRTTLLMQTDKYHEHARKCKSKLDECPLCQAAMKWFGLQSLADLSFVLSEKRTK